MAASQPGTVNQNPHQNPCMERVCMINRRRADCRECGNIDLTIPPNPPGIGTLAHRHHPSLAWRPCTKTFHERILAAPHCNQRRHHRRDSMHVSAFFHHQLLHMAVQSQLVRCLPDRCHRPCCAHDDHHPFRRIMQYRRAYAGGTASRRKRRRLGRYGMRGVPSEFQR